MLRLFFLSAAAAITAAATFALAAVAFAEKAQD